MKAVELSPLSVGWKCIAAQGNYSALCWRKERDFFSGKIMDSLSARQSIFCSFFRFFLKSCFL